MEYSTYTLTFSALRERNLRRVSEFGHGGLKEWDVPRWFMATTGELGELGNLLKKVERGDFQINRVAREVSDELADVAIYLDLLAARLGIDLDEAIRSKFNRTSDKIGSSVKI